MSWSYGFATNTGAVHGAESSAGQDSCSCRTVGHAALIAVVADGAGSADCGADGARLTCEKFADSLAASVKRRKNLAGLQDEDIREAFESVVQSIQAKASADGHSLEEYSCTLVAAAASDQETIFMQIGDGAAVYRAKKAFE